MLSSTDVSLRRIFLRLIDVALICLTWIILAFGDTAVINEIDRGAKVCVHICKVKARCKHPLFGCWVEDEAQEREPALLYLF